MYFKLKETLYIWLYVLSTDMYLYVNTISSL